MDQITRESALPYIELAPNTTKRFVCKICGGKTVRTKDKNILLDHIVQHLRDQYLLRPIAIAPQPANSTSPTLEFDEGDYNQMNNSSRRSYECFNEGCGRRFNSPSELNRHENTHTSTAATLNALKSFLIDEDEGLFLVRSTYKGQDFKVHVNIKSGTCENRDCLTSVADGSSLICRHIRSARSGNYANCELFNLSEELIENSNFSSEKKVSLRSIQEEAEIDLKPLIAEQSDDRTKIRHFSVFVTKSERAYVKMASSLRVITWKCGFCSNEISNNCVHVHAAMIIVGNDAQFDSSSADDLIRDQILKKYAE